MSPTATVASALATWVGTLGLTLAPTITTEPPSDGVIVDVPTLAIWFPTMDAQPVTPPRALSVTAGVGTFLFATLSGSVMFRFRCGSYADADTARDEFRALWMLSAMASNANSTPSLRLPVTLRGIATEATLRMGDAGAIYQSQPDAARNLWTLDFTGSIGWPEIARETGAGTGLLNIFYSVNGGAVVDVETQTATPTLEA